MWSLHSPHISEHRPFRMQSKHFNVLIHTLFPSLSIDYSSPYISPLPPPPFYRPTPLRSRCPNHLNLPRLTTSATLSTPRRLYKSTLRFLSFSDTPHIHLTIIRSVLSRLCRFAFFIARVSVPYVNTLWTQALYIFPFMWYDVP